MPSSLNGGNVLYVSHEQNFGYRYSTAQTIYALPEEVGILRLDTVAEWQDRHAAQLPHQKEAVTKQRFFIFLFFVFHVVRPWLQPICRWEQADGFVALSTAAVYDYRQAAH